MKLFYLPIQSLIKKLAYIISGVLHQQDIAMQLKLPIHFTGFMTLFYLC